MLTRELSRTPLIRSCFRNKVTPEIKLNPNVSSDRSWVYNVAADVSDGEATAETLAIRFANSESERWPPDRLSCVLCRQLVVCSHVAPSPFPPAFGTKQTRTSSRPRSRLRRPARAPSSRPLRRRRRPPLPRAARRPRPPPPPRPLPRRRRRRRRRRRTRRPLLLLLPLLRTRRRRRRLRRRRSEIEWNYEEMREREMRAHAMIRWLRRLQHVILFWSRRRNPALGHDGLAEMQCHPTLPCFCLTVCVFDLCSSAM